jgi:hypothetical protein
MMALKRAAVSSSASSQVMRSKRAPLPLRADPPARVEHAVLRVHQIQVMVDFVAEVAARHRMGVAFHLDGLAGDSGHCDPDDAGIRAIVRTSGMHHARAPLGARGTLEFVRNAHGMLQGAELQWVILPASRRGNRQAGAGVRGAGLATACTGVEGSATMARRSMLPAVVPMRARA